MEEKSFKKVEKSYYIFACSTCNNYSYVKTTQKGKKCLRCGRHHQVEKLKAISEVVSGISTAKDRIIELENLMARKELGSEPELRSENDFYIYYQDLQKSSSSNKIEHNGSDFLKFKLLLNTLRDKYKKFPLYLIEISAIDHQIPQEKLKFLIEKSIKNGIIKRTAEGLYFMVS
ncbi:MAG: DUF5817 domain-containing protein [Promethearchaeota archaeon]